MILTKYCSINKMHRNETTQILVGYRTDFLWPTLKSLQMFNVGALSSPAHVIFVSKFSPHICNHGRCKCSCSSSYPPGKSWKSRGHWWSVNSILYVPHRGKNRWYNVKWYDCLCQQISVKNLQYKNSWTAVWKYAGPLSTLLMYQ